jgi:hypothetical protein
MPVEDMFKKLLRPPQNWNGHSKAAGISGPTRSFIPVHAQGCSLIYEQENTFFVS